jgi:tetratricopeptide (TPR) repeat protein
MSKRVAGDSALDLDGMMKAVRNAIEIYEREIAGRLVETNLDDIVNRALAGAKEQIDRGRSALARATLDRAAKELEREEAERRERFIAGVTALRTHVRNYALAAYDGDAAARAIVDLARSIHGANVAKIAEFLSSEAQALYEYGRDRGSNVHLVAAIALRREQLVLATSADERGAACGNLGNGLRILGERESARRGLTRRLGPIARRWKRCARAGSARLGADPEQSRHCAGSARRTGERDDAPRRGGLGLSRSAEGKDARADSTRLAPTQTNLGNALLGLGERESGTEKLKEAVAAYRAALEEQTRERVPVDYWAATQSNLGAALAALGERESGTVRFEEAVRAFTAALQERTRERVPLGWAESFGNQGVTMMPLADRTNNGALAETATRQIEAAYETARDGGHEPWAVIFQAQLTDARAIRDRLKGK